MFSFGFLSALRNFRKHLLSNIVSLFSLTFGLSAAFLIALFVHFELSYDNWWPDEKNLYIYQTGYDANNGTPELTVMSPLAAKSALKRYFPEIEFVTQIFKEPRVLKIGDSPVLQDVWRVDNNFLDVLPIQFLDGVPDRAQFDYNTAFISEKMAAKLFDGDAIGQGVITIDGKRDFKVGGVFRDLPANSQFDFEVIIKYIPNDPQLGPRIPRNWGWKQGYTYLKLKPGVDPQLINSRMAAFLDFAVPPHHRGKDGGAHDFSLIMDIKDVHLAYNAIEHIKPPGDWRIVYSLSIIAVLILCVATVNFVNMSLAHTMERSKEVAVRKILGAQKKHLVFQYIGESVIFALLSLLLAVSLVEAVLPFMSSFLGKPLGFGMLGKAQVVVFSVLLVTVIGVLGGVYPALVAASFKPINLFNFGKKHSVGGFRGIQFYLVSAQFSVATTLAIFVFVLFQQDQLIGSQPLGFSFDKKLVIRNIERVVSADILANEMRNLGTVKSVSISRAVPADGLYNGSVATLTGDGPDRRVTFSHRSISANFFEQYQIPLKSGRYLSAESELDQISFNNDRRRRGVPGSIVLNEATIKQFGFSSADEAIGKHIKWRRLDLTIVGVVEDFHPRSLKEKIRPYIYYMNPELFYAFTIEYDPNVDLIQVHRELEEVWRNHASEIPFEFYYLDDAIDALYLEDRKMAFLLAVFFGVSIIIACMGLYALSVYSASRRTKEIGVRKVYGATNWKILKLMVWQFTKPVVFGGLMAWPLAYFISREYLDGFEYRIDIEIGYFLVGSLMTIAMSWLAVAWHSVRVSRSLPIGSLRYE
ncbi:MAG: ABC transporter permease [Kordiimonadaceae bacterium]|nr:ABC transporter permease [Kordiimonadaceae bacterium]